MLKWLKVFYFELAIILVFLWSTDIKILWQHVLKRCSIELLWQIFLNSLEVCRFHGRQLKHGFDAWPVLRSFESMWKDAVSKKDQLLDQINRLSIVGTTKTVNLDVIDTFNGTNCLKWKKCIDSSGSFMSYAKTQSISNIWLTCHNLELLISPFIACFKRVCPASVFVERNGRLFNGGFCRI